MPHALGRRVVTLLVAVSLLALLAACSGDPSAKAKTEPPPTTGAQKPTALMAQWRYQSVITPKKKRVPLAPTNAWLRLGADGYAQGQDGRPWQGSYRTGRGWITFEASDPASPPMRENQTRAARLASTVTTTLLRGDRVKLRRPRRGLLRMSIDGYVLTLKPWR